MEGPGPVWGGTDEHLLKEVKKQWYGQNIKRRYEFIIKFEEHVSAGLKSTVFIETICEVWILPTNSFIGSGYFSLIYHKLRVFIISTIQFTFTLLFLIRF